MRIAIIGTGKLGRALANALHPGPLALVGVHDKNLTLGHEFARRHNLRFFSDPIELISLSDVVFLTVPDNILASLAQVFATYKPHNQIFFHCSGASGPELIAPLSATAQIGCFHPLQTFVSEQTSFQDVWIALDGRENVQETARQIAHYLGAKTFTVPAQDKALYHAAACILSNYLVTLSAVAEDLFSTWQLPKSAFMPLLSGSLQNLFNTEHSIGALTGPILRGDSSTIAKHLKVLPTEYQALYRTLGITTCQLLMRTGQAPENCQQLEHLFATQEDNHE